MITLPRFKRLWGGLAALSPQLGVNPQGLFAGDGFNDAIVSLLRSVNTLNNLSWRYSMQVNAFSVTAQAGTALVSGLQGLCNQALAQTTVDEQKATFPKALWDSCKQALISLRESIPGWYDPSSNTGHFTEAYDAAVAYTATELMSLKNHIAALSNLQSDKMSELSSALTMTQQTYNVCNGVIKSMNDLMYQAVEAVVKGA